MTQPIFIHAAIMFLDEKGNVQRWTGTRYNDIFQQIVRAGYYHTYMKWHVYGFMLDYGVGKEMFLNAENATDLARQMGITMKDPNHLMPEDLW